MMLSDAGPKQLRAWIADPKNAAVRPVLERRLAEVTAARANAPIERLTLTLPLPSPVLSPNGRGHVMTKSSATKKYRKAAKLEAENALDGHTPPRWKRAQAQAVFYFRVDRRRDRDNLAASLKAAWDGIADAGVVENDCGLTHLPPVLRVDRDAPRVEITLTPMDER
jgi:Holliday junction resolvase RusA-like endonuclease